VVSWILKDTGPPRTFYSIFSAPFNRLKRK
jgi:hypothetical protein